MKIQLIPILENIDKRSLVYWALCKLLIRFNIKIKGFNWTIKHQD